MFLRKVFLKICSKFAGEHPCQSEISIKLQNYFIKIALRHECSHLFLRIPLDGCFWKQMLTTSFLGKTTSRNGQKTLECQNVHFTFCVKSYDHIVRVKPRVNSQLSPLQSSSTFKFCVFSNSSWISSSENCPSVRVGV